MSWWPTLASIAASELRRRRRRRRRQGLCGGLWRATGKGQGQVLYLSGLGQPEL